MEAWKRPGDVAEEKLTLLKSFTVVSKVFPHINTEDVLAVPEPPTNKTPFCWKAVLEWTGRGWSKIEFTKKSVLQESTVGSKS